MSENDLAAIAAWLRLYQGFDPDPAELGETAASAQRLSALARRAGRDLPFDAEPSGFGRTHESAGKARREKA